MITVSPFFCSSLSPSAICPSGSGEVCDPPAGTRAAAVVAAGRAALIFLDCGKLEHRSDPGPNSLGFPMRISVQMLVPVCVAGRATACILRTVPADMRTTATLDQAPSTSQRVYYGTAGKAAMVGIVGDQHHGVQRW